MAYKYRIALALTPPRLSHLLIAYQRSALAVWRAGSVMAKIAQLSKARVIAESEKRIMACGGMARKKKKRHVSCKAAGESMKEKTAYRKAANNESVILNESNERK